MATGSGPKNILVTGATSGIGFELVKRLSERHRILATGRTMSDRLAQLIEERPDVRFVEADQSEPAAAARNVLASVEEAGWAGLNHAILNAGTGKVGDPGELPAHETRTMLATNLTANVHLAHALYPALAGAKGTLTFIGSTARKGAPMFAGYAASKAGLHGLARALREEWRGKVLVQIIHPGPTRTDMHRKAGFDPGKLAMVFADPAGMASMIEKSIARGKKVVTLSPLHYWSGNSFLGRGL